MHASSFFIQEKCITCQTKGHHRTIQELKNVEKKPFFHRREKRVLITLLYKQEDKKKVKFYKRQA